MEPAISKSIFCTCKLNELGGNELGSGEIPSTVLPISNNTSKMLMPEWRQMQQPPRNRGVEVGISFYSYTEKTNKQQQQNKTIFVPQT